MADDADQYEAYYADKLWNLLPELYRAGDSVEFGHKGPLRELVERIGAQAAVVRRSIDRMWEDQSIETCDDWLIPYIADLLATNLVPSLDARGQRIDVARTIFYRRRKGTVAVLEQLASDITGWDARVVELFRRLGRTRHGLDPAIGWPEDSRDPQGARELQQAQGLVGRVSRTPLGGLADLRSVHGAAQSRTAFDELSYTADFRKGQGVFGWHNIPRLGVFLWRLKSVPVGPVTPVRDADHPEQFTFDPTGRDIPLFAASERSYGEEWLPPAEHQVPGPISRLLLRAALPQLYAGPDAQDPSLVLPRSLAVYQKGELIQRADVSADPKVPAPVQLDPERGRFSLQQPPQAMDFSVGYHYGFSSNIGAGAYDRRKRGQAVMPLPQLFKVVEGGGSALASELGSNGTFIIKDSLTYSSVPLNLTVGKLVLRAENRSRPLIRPPPGDGSGAPQTWVLTGSQGAELVLDGIFLSGCEVVLAGHFKSVTLLNSTLDPGTYDMMANKFAISADKRPLGPCRLWISGHVEQLTVERSIVGPIRLKDGSAALDRLTIEDSIVQTISGSFAIEAPTAAVELNRTTLLGPASVHRLEASGCILFYYVTAIDTQHGCVRFSAYRQASSKLPRLYECQALVAFTGVFASSNFGHPGYGQLLPTVSPAITEGNEDGSEMGAFSSEKNAIKERSLRIKYQEYMPIGLTPVLIYVT